MKLFLKWLVDFNDPTKPGEMRIPPVVFPGSPLLISVLFYIYQFWPYDNFGTFEAAFFSLICGFFTFFAGAIALVVAFVLMDALFGDIVSSFTAYKEAHNKKKKDAWKDYVKELEKEGVVFPEHVKESLSDPVKPRKYSANELEDMRITLPQLQNAFENLPQIPRDKHQRFIRGQITKDIAVKTEILKREGIL